MWADKATNYGCASASKAQNILGWLRAWLSRYRLHEIDCWVDYTIRLSQSFSFLCAFGVLATKPRQLSSQAMAVNSHVDGFEEWISDAAGLQSWRPRWGKSDKILARIRFNKDWFRWMRRYSQKYWSRKMEKTKTANVVNLNRVHHLSWSKKSSNLDARYVFVCFENFQDTRTWDMYWLNC